MASKRIVHIKDTLEKLYGRYNHKKFIPPDPLQFVYRYRHKADMEIAGFLASSLAYGGVQQIEKSLAGLFGHMGDSPFKFVQNFNQKQGEKLKDFKHRFTKGDDISDLLTLLKKVLGRYGSIEKCFVQNYNPSDRSVIPALSKFCDSLLDMYAKTHNGSVTKGLSYLLPRPAAGSACKRLNLFLRWMVRDDDVDAGLWKSIGKAKLIVPVDVHIGRLCKILGFYDRKSISLSTALEITDGFRQIEPADPVKYDFALSRIGIVENCNGNFRPECQACELAELC